MNRIQRLAHEVAHMEQKLDMLADYLRVANTPGTESVLAAAKRAALELHTLTIELEKHA